jgi:hypothetical protein
MNLPTHIAFGALIGALFFGRWDIILLFAIGSVLPDMDREYGFFSKDYFASINSIELYTTTSFSSE